MDVAEAWSITTGSSTIRVAVLDDGIELNHPDLVSNLLPGFDAIGGGAGAPNQYDRHGTPCAGIIAAQANNGIGTAGVAYSSRIVPIRSYANNYSTTEALAASIDWAWQNNRADILSISWETTVSQQPVREALYRAVTRGRNGLGCLVFASSANSNSNLTFPSSVSSVIAVGATTNTDHRATYSNYGTGLDVVAPGEAILSTDRQGSVGYTTSDYVEFGGTSAACPNAAGVAALILSANPYLTQQQARHILESTADKVGGYAYAQGAGENTDLSWNNEMGYGRINAHAATLAACAFTVPISGNWHSSTNPYNQTTSLQTSQTVPSGNITVQVYSGAGTTYYFEAQQIIQNSPRPTVTQSGNTATFSIGPSGTYNERVYLDVTATNPAICGGTITSTTTTFYFFVPRSYYMASPNPTSSDVVVQDTDPAAARTAPLKAPPRGIEPTDSPFEAQLYNSYGKLVKTGPSEQGQVKFDVRDLPEGLYTLRAGAGKETFSQHIQVAH